MCGTGHTLCILCGSPRQAQVIARGRGLSQHCCLHGDSRNVQQIKPGRERLLILSSFLWLCVTSLPRGHDTQGRFAPARFTQAEGSQGPRSSSSAPSSMLLEPAPQPLSARPHCTAASPSGLHGPARPTGKGFPDLCSGEPVSLRSEFFSAAPPPSSAHTPASESEAPSSGAADPVPPCAWGCFHFKGVLSLRESLLAPSGVSMVTGLSGPREEASIHSTFQTNSSFLIFFSFSIETKAEA